MRLLLILFIVGAGYYSAFGQSCNFYTAMQYGYTEELNITYGSAVDYEGNNVSLQLNLFKPVGDDNSQRPLLIFIHGGGFTEGNRDDFNELCRWYAMRGYVTATISYRLGLHHVIHPIVAWDHHELLRANYRGMQDTRGAIRFLKQRADLDSTDIHRVGLIGASAGGFIALHSAYENLPEEKSPSAFAIDPILFIERPDLGPIEGTMNLNGHSTDVQAVVNIFGGMRDTSLIAGADDVPVYAYHQTGDPVVACHRNKPYWADFPDTNNPVVDGSCAIQAKTQQLGFSSENAVFHLYDGNEHDVHDLVQLDAEIAIFLNEHLCDVVSAVANEAEVQPVNVYPNPAEHELFIDGHKIQQAQLISITGKLVLNEVFASDDVRIDVAAFPRGLYFLRLTSARGDVSQHKVVLK